jgi:hypothetical protein
MPIAMQETTKQILEILAGRGRPGPLYIVFDAILFPEAVVGVALQDLPDGVLARGGTDPEMLSGLKVLVPDDPSQARLLVGELLNRVIVGAHLANG